MNTKIESPRNIEAKDSRAQKAIRLLMSMDGDPKRQKRSEFEKFYPAVLHAIDRKVPRKAILKLLSEGGLKLYPALFEEFLDSMGKEYANQSEITGLPIDTRSPGGQEPDPALESSQAKPDPAHSAGFNPSGARA